MRRIALLLTLLLLLCCAVAAAEEEPAALTDSSGDYEYILLEDGSAEIAGYSGSAEELEVPAELDGLSVTSIGDGAFCNCDSLTSVTIPDSVTSIGEGAFAFCESLARIALPNSVTFIDASPFVGCSQLQTIQVSPDHPVFATIDGVLFEKAEKKLVCYPAGLAAVAYTIPDGVLSIGDNAFYGCDNLAIIFIPDGVTSIGDGAFTGCSKLTRIIIPNSVTSIGTSPFCVCTQLQAIHVFPDHPIFTTIDGVLFKKAEKMLVCYPSGLPATEYVIPDGTLSIGESAFIHCYNLTSVIIPDSVASIGESAFYGCDWLTHITIPDSVTSIGESAFYGCGGLTTITIPDSVTSIGEGAFSRCARNFTLTVNRDSYAAEYAAANGISYTYPDANDWLYS